MDYLTIANIIKTTGKSQSTILRWVRKLKEIKPEAVKVERRGKTRIYLISKNEVERAFSLKEEKKEGLSNNIPAGYVLIPEATLKSLEEQLRAKDEQIRKLQEVNYIQSGFIAQVKMLGAGQKKYSFVKKERQKRQSSQPQPKKKEKKSLFKRIFGIN